MTATPVNIRPRLRTRASEVEPAAPEPLSVPDRLLLPRVLIRVPQLGAGSQTTSSSVSPIGVLAQSSPLAQTGEINQTFAAAATSAASAINSTPEELAAAAENDSIFNTLWAQATTFVPAKYWKVMGIGLVLLTGLWWVGGRRHRAAPTAPGSDAPAWTGPVSTPWPNQPGEAASHGSTGAIPTWNPGPQIAAQPPAAQFAGGTIAAGQKPANLVPTGPFATGGLPPAGAAFASGQTSGSQNQPRGDTIPAMPSRDPAWIASAPRDNSPLTQGNPRADGYRTAQRFDPTAVPVGRGESTQPGVARLQGNITGPPAGGQ